MYTTIYRMEIKKKINWITNKMTIEFLYETYNTYKDRGPKMVIFVTQLFCITFFYIYVFLFKHND